jgi:hypothetical protein
MLQLHLWGSNKFTLLQILAPKSPHQARASVPLHDDSYVFQQCILRGNKLSGGISVDSLNTGCTLPVEQLISTFRTKKSTFYNVQARTLRSPQQVLGLTVIAAQRPWKSKPCEVFHGIRTKKSGKPRAINWLSFRMGFRNCVVLDFEHFKAFLICYIVGSLTKFSSLRRNIYLVAARKMYLS